MNKLHTVLFFSLPLLFSSCAKLADTYKWADETEALDESRWSFSETEDLFKKEEKMKARFKTEDGTRAGRQFTLYNQSIDGEDQLMADFTAGDLYLDRIKLTAGTPFEIHGLKKISFTFIPTAAEGKITITIYSLITGKEKKPLIYVLELLKNEPPKAVFTAGRTDERRYDFDAGDSKDLDEAMGGKLVTISYNVKELSTGDSQSFSFSASQKVFSYPFPRPGKFEVTLTVSDNNVEPGKDSVTLIIDVY